MLAAVLEELRNLRAKHETVVLCGHSMGGALATLAAAQMELEGLILGAPYYAVTFKWFYLLHAEQWARLLSPVLRWIHVSPEQQPVKRKEVSSQILSYPWIPTRAFLSAMTLAADASRPETLERITCPTLLLHSTQDKVTDPGAAARAFALIGAAQRTAVWLDNSDHLIFWDYEPRSGCARNHLLPEIPEIAAPTLVSARVSSSPHHRVECPHEGSLCSSRL